ncbi:zinc ribbon domain-containing protein [Halothece sp. PCC 7418]|uniref:zinc ribbon domain-containing protein n=1 Tax=Halothece sp. (strain PCC 7418) TaxID=65093 RepID=UPI00030DBB76|nr:zinc ribbon domain-containing protein [Halothece sp. PCC 7418]
MCWKRGKYFSEVEAKGSTQTCPRCSTHVGKDLSVRIHECPQCNLVADRDVAAACVLRSRGIEKINSTVGRIGNQNA